MLNNTISAGLSILMKIYMFSTLNYSKNNK